ncbi:MULTISPECIES: CynX/NimT family MFS transporter [unclassified Sphingobium]|uniref:MFS transporter n=1 Tax=unclassified Sphingobium TaxID=2611147 RepID=UPI002224F992|nr:MULTISPECIES: MFS transporter [unclassified Sphingobium]MCW2381248.1 MFS family permease [Sphingobium sp. B2D3B]MCW2398645.1 MFS family permease [Sphingobium sp. B2D3C]
MTYEGRKKYLALTAFCLLFFMLNAFTFNGLGVVLPYMVEEMGWPWAVAGLGFTFLGVACGLSSLAPAISIRRLGVSRTMMIGGALLLIGFTCLAVTKTAMVYFIGTAFAGVGFSMCGTTGGVNVISHSFEKRSTAMGVYFTAGGMGAVVGPLIAFSTQAITGEWRHYWWTAAIAAVLLSMFAALVTSDRPGDAEVAPKPRKAMATDGWTARAAMRTAQYYIVVGVYTSFLLINTTVHGFAVKHLTETGLTMGAAATVMSGIALVSAAGSMIAGMAGEKIGARELTLLSITSTSLGVLALMIGGNLFVVSLAVIGLGVGFGFSYVSTAMLMLNLFGKRANLELYSTMSLISTAAAIGPALGGVIRDETGGFSFVFLGCALLGFIFVGALLLLRTPELPQQDTAEDAEPALAA